MFDLEYKRRGHEACECKITEQAKIPICISRSYSTSAKIGIEVHMNINVKLVKHDFKTYEIRTCGTVNKL